MKRSKKQTKKKGGLESTTKIVKKIAAEVSSDHSMLLKKVFMSKHLESPKKKIPSLCHPLCLVQNIL